MSDIAEIQSLLVRQKVLVDARDLASLQGCYTADVTQVVRSSGASEQRLSGRETLLRSMADGWARADESGRPPTVHFVGPASVDVDGPGQATATSMCLYLSSADGRTVGWGHYVDTMRRERGRWRIAARALSATFLPAPAVTTPQNPLATKEKTVSTPDPSGRPLAELWRFTGRTVIVTGGASGMGEAAALRFAEAGARVVVADLDAAGAERTAKTARAAGNPDVLGTSVDITDPADVTRLAEKAEERFGPIDVWANTAGAVTSAALVDTTDEEWRRIVGVNLDGTFFCGREAARRMQASGRGGAIVFVTSGSAHRGRQGRHPYVAGKHGAAGLTKSMARELGPFGIRVLAVAPGMIDTPMLRRGQSDTATGRAGRLAGEVRTTTEQDIVLGRIGVADDVARVVLFAASDAAAFMTGSTLHVDGGALTR
jgi:NAD(P)-dependent dehydrogenase (short-subunit alcohol dehydrogenase family)